MPGNCNRGFFPYVLIQCIMNLGYMRIYFDLIIESGLLLMLRTFPIGLEEYVGKKKQVDSLYFQLADYLDPNCL
jgi:hypothetical protein